jgi:hypothetical protein
MPEYKAKSEDRAVQLEFWQNTIRQGRLQEQAAQQQQQQTQTPQEKPIENRRRQLSL